MEPDINKSIFLDLLTEYTKAQMKVLEEDPSISTGTIHYRLKNTIEYLDKKKREDCIAKKEDKLDEIVDELKKLWGEEWELTLEMVGNNRDAWDRYPAGYIQKSNELIRKLNNL